MNPLTWKRVDRIAFVIGAVFGACIGFVVGIRRLDPAMNQDLYWLWLGLWVGPGALIGAAGTFIWQLFLPRGARERDPNKER